MTLMVITCFFAANGILLVESFDGCHVSRFTKNFKKSCERWWDRMDSIPTFDNDSRECINLIIEKCPDMLVIERTIKPLHVKSTGEVWEDKITATHKVKGNTKESQQDVDKPLCWDNDGKYTSCDYWWYMAMGVTLEDSIRDYCINNVLKHCDNMITKVGERSTCEKRSCQKDHDFLIVTYKDEKGGTATVTRQLTLDNNDSQSNS